MWVSRRNARACGQATNFIKRKQSKCSQNDVINREMLVVAPSICMTVFYKALRYTLSSSTDQLNDSGNLALTLLSLPRGCFEVSARHGSLFSVS